jgi:predicted PurR-regulated permease PerM
LIVIVSQGGTFGMAVAVAVVIGVVQAIDGMFITPRIIGERAGVHPVVVIASVIAFGDLFGILGILIAVPVVDIVSASFQMALPYYRNSPFYRQG